MEDSEIVPWDWNKMEYTYMACQKPAYFDQKESW